jgi:Holliday junction DNA helicase RuvA
MYEYIKGTLAEKDPQKAVVEAGGIGYKLMIPLSAFSRLPPLKKPVELYLSHIVREDSETLYAFITREERDLFELLLTVSGIGPKTGISIVGHADIGTFQRAIASSDVRLLSKIPGIGKKTAERLVIEMRDKFKGKKGTVPTLEPGLHSDAYSALINLGYPPQEAQKAVAEVIKRNQEETDLGRVITAALKEL